MNEILHFVGICFKVGFLGCLALLGLLYVIASSESHCWDPRGCIDPKQVAYQDEQDKILRQGGWGK